MHTTINVGDLSPEQWQYLEANVPVSREFGPSDVRMCVTFEGLDNMSLDHVELAPREFITLIERLSQVDTGSAGKDTGILPDAHRCAGCSFTTASAERMDGHLKATGHQHEADAVDHEAEGYMHMQDMPAEYDTDELDVEAGWGFRNPEQQTHDFESHGVSGYEL